MSNHREILLYLENTLYVFIGRYAFQWIAVVAIPIMMIVETALSNVSFCIASHSRAKFDKVLVMIRHVVVDGADTVELFEEEEMGHVVGGGHGGKGEAEVRAGFEGFWEAVGATKNDGNVIAEVFVGFEEGGQGFACVFGPDGV